MGKERYIVIKDTREKLGWTFEPSNNCQGMLVQKMDEADYTIQGYEDKLVIERKGSLSEFAGNLMQDRFYRELERLEKYPFPFIVLEFEFSDIFEYPYNSMPPRQASYCKVSPFFLLKKIMDLQIQYKVKLIFAGNRGKEAAASLFKQVMEYYETDNGR